MGYIPENLGEIYELAWKGNDWQETPFSGARWVEGNWMNPPNPGQEYVQGRWMFPPNPGQQWVQGKWLFPPSPPYPGAKYLGAYKWTQLAVARLASTQAVQKQGFEIPAVVATPAGAMPAILNPGGVRPPTEKSMGGGTNWLLIGGLGAAAVAAFFIFKKKNKGKK